MHNQATAPVPVSPSGGHLHHPNLRAAKVRTITTYRSHIDTSPVNQWSNKPRFRSSSLCNQLLNFQICTPTQTTSWPLSEPIFIVNDSPNKTWPFEWTLLCLSFLPSWSSIIYFSCLWNQCIYRSSNTIIKLLQEIANETGTRAISARGLPLQMDAEFVHLLRFFFFFFFCFRIFLGKSIKYHCSYRTNRFRKSRETDFFSSRKSR